MVPANLAPIGRGWRHGRGRVSSSRGFPHCIPTCACASSSSASRTPPALGPWLYRSHPGQPSHPHMHTDYYQLNLGSRPQATRWTPPLMSRVSSIQREPRMYRMQPLWINGWMGMDGWGAGCYLPLNLPLSHSTSSSLYISHFHSSSYARHGRVTHSSHGTNALFKTSESSSHKHSIIAEVHLLPTFDLFIPDTKPIPTLRGLCPLSKPPSLNTPTSTPKRHSLSAHTSLLPHRSSLFASSTPSPFPSIAHRPPRAPLLPLINSIATRPIRA